MLRFLFVGLILFLTQFAIAAEPLNIQPVYWQHLNASWVYVDPQGKAWFLKVVQGEPNRWLDRDGKEVVRNPKGMLNLVDQKGRFWFQEANGDNRPYWIFDGKDWNETTIIHSRGVRRGPPLRSRRRRSSMAFRSSAPGTSAPISMVCVIFIVVPMSSAARNG